MAEQLQYYNHDQLRIRAEGLSKPNEVHELAADAQHLGGAAVHSEINAANAFGVRSDATVPNPAADYREPRTFRSFYGAGKARHGRVAAVVERADMTLAELQAGLDDYAISGETGRPLHDIAPGSRGIQVLRDMEPDSNREHILHDAAIPSVFRTAKDIAAKAQARDPEAFSWQEWFNTATDEQLTNFAQWYTERLKLLADPESKAAFAARLKNDYKFRIGRAMRDGWIDKKHRATLDQKLARAQVRFFSPFGRMPEQIVGKALKQDTDKSILLFPTLAGKWMRTHEFGHVFAGINGRTMLEYFKQQRGILYIDRRYSQFRHLNNILNEGFDDHMTAALLNGEPTMVRPSERNEQNTEPAHASKAYSAYREVFGVLLGGENGTITRLDIRNVVDSMVARDFESFAGIINRKWGGRDVLTEMVEVIAKYDHDKKRNPNDASYNENLLAARIIDRLQKARNKTALADSHA